jgi:hypothetical protein
MAAKDEAKKIFDDLSKRANELADDSLSGLPKLVDGLMMPDKMVVKKLLSLKSPLMSDLDLNLMVYGKDLKKELGSQYKAFFSESVLEKFNPELLKANLKSPFQPIPEDFPLFDEVKKIKTEVKDGVFLLQEKQKALLAEITKLGVLTGSTIPAAVLLVAPLNFNVPGAITLTVNLLNQISAVKEKFKEFTPALRVVDKLKFVIPDDKVEQVISPINTIVQAISGFKSALNPLEIFSKIQEEKQQKVEEFRQRMSDVETRIKNLKIEDFVDLPDPALALENRKKELENIKEGISTQVESLLKQGN